MKVEVNQRYGKLITVEKFSDILKSGKRVSKFKCVCDCGNRIDVSYSNLQSGNTTACYDCGRTAVGEKLSVDHTGYKNNQVTLLSRSNYKSQRVWKWHAICDCGVNFIVNPLKVIAGTTKSCGHLQKQKASETLTNPLVQKKIRDSNVEKYGVENVMKDYSIAYKCAINQRSNVFVPNWETGELVPCASSYERIVVAYFNKNKISFDAQIQFKMPSGCMYTIDFFDKTRNTYIEVKGYHRKKNMIKYDEFALSYPCELWGKEKIAELVNDYRRDLSFAHYWTWEDLRGMSQETLRTYPGIHVYPHEIGPGLTSFLKSKIDNKTVYARKTKLVELTAKQARDFVRNRHIQGASNRTILGYGLELDGKLVAVASFSKHHRNNQDWVLERFACEPGITVVGGLSKLTKHAREQLGPLTSWADRSISNGDGYLAAGWTLDGIEKSDYFYFDPAQGKVISKQARKKSSVGTPDGMTEAEHAALDGLWKIPKLGKIRFTYP